MTLTLHQAHQQCGQLLSQAISQLTQERQSDPLSNVSLTRLNSLSAGVKKAMAMLEEEATVFSDGADLSSLTTENLNSLASDIREASRKLSIVLAAGSNQFRGQAQSDVQLLDSLKSYFDPTIAQALNLDALIPVLQSGLKEGACQHGYPHHQGYYEYDEDAEEAEYYNHACPHGCASQGLAVEPSVTLTNDFGPESSAAASMKILSEHFSALAKACEQIHADQNSHAQEKGEKTQVHEQLTQDVSELVPLLRSHVLRIGIAKGQHLNISNGCGNVATITSLFDYAAVENAHRQLEEGRDRILQELTLRRLESKMHAQTPAKGA